MGVPRQRVLLGSEAAVVAAAAGLSALPYFYTVFDDNDGDIPLYFRAASHLLGGDLPYRDFVFEYPPYAFVLFLLPSLARGYAGFRILFSLELLALDLVTRAWLARRAVRSRAPAREAWTPFAIYVLAATLQSYYALKRLDLVAASLALYALVAFAGNRSRIAGALLALATGVKLYPLLAIPALLRASSLRGDARRFVAGVIAGSLPAAALALVVPWWRFAVFHTARGLEGGSSYASILWLLHFLGLRAVWVGRAAWMEVDGPAARLLLPAARLAFVTATAGSVLVSVRALGRRASVDPLADLGRAVLMPFTAFMAFGIVFSGQYALWLAAPVAIAAAQGRASPLVWIMLGIVLTIFVFPANGWAGDGIGLGCTLTLVARNITLLVAWALLVREGLQPSERRSPGS